MKNYIMNFIQNGIQYRLPEDYCYINKYYLVENKDLYLYDSDAYIYIYYSYSIEKLFMFSLTLMSKHLLKCYPFIQ